MHNIGVGVAVAMVGVGVLVLAGIGWALVATGLIVGAVTIYATERINR